MAMRKRSALDQLIAIAILVAMIHGIWECGVRASSAEATTSAPAVLSRGESADNDSGDCCSHPGACNRCLPVIVTRQAAISQTCRFDAERNYHRLSPSGSRHRSASNIRLAPESAVPSLATSRRLSMRRDFAACAAVRIFAAATRAQDPFELHVYEHESLKRGEFTFEAHFESRREGHARI